MKKVISFIKLCFILLLSVQQVTAQSVAINSTGSSPDASSILDLTSSSKGVLIPRVSLTSLTDAITITSPATSLLIYNTNTAITNGKGYYFNNGTPASPSWVKLVVVDATGIVQSTTPSGDVIKLERFPMGEVSMQGNTTITPVTMNVWVKVAGITSLSSGSYQFSNGSTDNRLVYTGASEKMFHIACTLSVKSSSSSSNLKAVLYKNGVALSAGIIQTKMGSSSDIISTAIHVSTNLQNGDYLELWLTNTISSSDFTVTEMNLFAMGVSMGMD